MFACNHRKEDCTSNFKYDYKVLEYSSESAIPDNPIGSKFYLNGNLVRSIAQEGGCTRYFYDSSNRIIEERWGRNCCYGRRNIYLYDSLNNLVGYYNTLDSVFDIDTIQLDQIFYYDDQNRLIKELKHSGAFMNGTNFEKWNHYKYCGDKIITEITTINSDTEWVGSYIYDSSDNLIEIIRIRDTIYLKETFKYNNEGLLVEKTISSNEYPLEPNVSYSASNNSLTYQFDSTGFITKEIRFSHKGEQQYQRFFLKIKNINAP